MKNIKQLLLLIKTLAGKNGEIYVVGGWLRDILLGRPNSDLDIACPKDPLKLARSFSKAVSGHLITLDDKNKIYRVIVKDCGFLEYVDFAKFKGPDIVSDLRKRDFTANSLAAKILKDGAIDLKALLDPCSGAADIKNRTLRISYPKSFQDDPLRLLRAFRIAAETGFTIDPGTLKSVKRNSKLIVKSAPERIKDELIKILSRDDSARWIAMLESVTLLERLIPEIVPMKKSARNFYFHPKGLWQHCFETLVSMESLFKNLPEYFGQHAKEMAVHLESQVSSGMDRKALLKLTAILHDCAKPECAARTGGKTRFLGHEEKGAAKVQKIFTRLKMGKKETQIAKALVENHMRPVSLSQTGTVTQRASFRLFRDIGDNTPDLLLLALADWHSYKRIKTNKPKNLKIQEAILKELIARYYALSEKKAAPKLIDGNILMKILKLKPGPVIGHLLKVTEEAQALGKIHNTAGAAALASRELTRCAKKYKITL
jgi:poly(A) polymerase